MGNCARPVILKLWTSHAKGCDKEMQKPLSWRVSTDFGRSFVSYTSLVHAQPALQAVGVYVCTSRLYNEHYDAWCRSMGIKTPRRRVKLEPRVIIRRLDDTTNS